MQVRHAVIIGALALVVLAPAPARADWLFSPFIGTTFGTNLIDDEGEGDEQFENKVNYGATLTYMGAGVFGFEIDFGYAPEFFEANDDDFDFIDKSNLTTLMFNLVLGVPIGGQTGGGVRPYGSGGIGLMRSHVEGIGDLFEDVNSNSLGLNLGGGVIGFFGDNVGVKGDLRYFRGLTEDEDSAFFDLGLGKFEFWRGTGAIVFRF